MCVFARTFFVQREHSGIWYEGQENRGRGHIRGRRKNQEDVEFLVRLVRYTKSGRSTLHLTSFKSTSQHWHSCKCQQQPLFHFRLIVVYAFWINKHIFLLKINGTGSAASEFVKSLEPRRGWHLGNLLADSCRLPFHALSTCLFWTDEFKVHFYLFSYL